MSADKLMIGAHLSTSQGLPAMVRTAVALGAECVQLFTSSPQQWRGKRYTAVEADAFAAAQAEAGIGPFIAHESYLINLASSDPELLAKSRLAFAEEIARCGQLRLPMLVIHWGSYKGGTLDDGMARLADSLAQAQPLADAAGVQIVLETTAGQGSYLGGDFAQFLRLFALLPDPERLGVCLDTCHVFAAGYDLRDQALYDELWRRFDGEIGLHRLRVIHVNDTEKRWAATPTVTPASARDNSAWKPSAC